ncbi:MAG: hypothetical protein Q6K99_09005, partial [Thermostichales cyanobacterium BF4_bins_65]
VARAEPATNLSFLYQQLEQAVAKQEWAIAQGIVRQLIVLQPERALELNAYQQRLNRLLGVLPPLPTPSPEPLPFLERLRIQAVTARVKTTREEIQYSYPIWPACTALRTTVILPDTYEVRVQVIGPTGLPTQRVPVEISLNQGAMEITPELALGSQAMAIHRWTFRATQLPQPRTVRVTLPNGVSRSFTVDLPSAGTVLERGRTVVIRGKVSERGCVWPWPGFVEANLGTVRKQ